MAKRLSTSGIDFDWNYSSSVIIGRKGFGAKLNKECAKIFQRHMYKYIPFDTGKMANSVRISGNNNRGMITYTTDYAHYLYTGDIKGHIHNKNNPPYKHALATSYWDKACWTIEKREILNEINAYRRRHSV